MAAPVPSCIWSSQAAVTGGGSTTISVIASGSPTNTATAFMPSVGDLVVIVQEGLTSGAAAPSAPTSGAGSSTGWTDGPGTSGTDVYQNDTTAGHGRIQVWSKVWTADDVTGGNIIIKFAGFQASNRSQIYVIPGSWGSDRLKAENATNANGTSSFSYTGSDRDSITIAAGAYVAGQTSLTFTYDGATSGVKFQRDPYCDESSTQTETGDGTGHTGTNHYGTGTGLFQSDYQEYAAGSPASSVAWVGSNVANTTHALAFVHYQELVAFDPALETDAAQALGKTKTLAVGTATETDAAQAITSFQGHAVIRADETDTAQALGKTKTLAVGTATETDTALSLPHLARALGIATETEAAQAFTAYKQWSAEILMDSPPAGMSVTAGSLTAAFNYPGDVGDIEWSVKQGSTTLVTSGWLALTYAAQTFTLTVPATAGTDFRIWWQVRTATAVDPLISEPTLSTSWVTALGTATETDAAQVVDAIIIHDLGQTGTIHTTFWQTIHSDGQHTPRQFTQDTTAADSTQTFRTGSTLTYIEE